MNKKLVTIGFSVLLLTLVSVLPAFAVQSSNVKSSSKEIVVKGEGYTVYIDNNLTKESILGQGDIQPLSATYYSISQGGSGTFNGRTYSPFGNGNLVLDSSISVYDYHYLLQDDKILANGALSAYWTGTVPSPNCDEVIAQPSQTVNSTTTTYTVSAPSGVNQNFTQTSQTLTWPQVSVPNNWQNNYSWDQWEVGTSGHFTNISANDTAGFRFGTDTYAISNTVTIAIN